MFQLRIVGAAAVLATLAFLPVAVHAVRAGGLSEDLSLAVEQRAAEGRSDAGSCDASLTYLEVMIFNLEGRGGNQGNADGVARREFLASWFTRRCADWNVKTGPHIVMTQEDIAADIADCFQSLVFCESEDYWWREAEKSPDGMTVKGAEKFGDGTRMKNKIYVHKDLITSLPWTATVGTISLDNAGTSNPRCAATATFTMQVPVGGACQEAVFSLASFHLSGGYVDDAEVKRAVEAATAEPPVTTIRERQLNQVATSLGCSTGRCIMGGDTNGFPDSQVSDCQSGRLDWMFGNKEAQKQWFRRFLTIPESVASGGSVLSRVQAVGTADFCGLSEESSEAATTVWGGQPDQFYTNVAGAAAAVVPGGLIPKQRERGHPFARRLSDHNAVLLQIPLAALAA